MSPLDGSELVAGRVIEAGHISQFYNLLTGVMVDQPVLLKNRLTLTRDAAAAPATLNYLLVTGVADTAVTAEANDVYFNLARTLQFATASIPTQNRAVRIAAPTYSSVGAGTLATAATVAISGAPAAGTNLTITNTYALLSEGGANRLVGRLELGDRAYFGQGTSVLSLSAGAGDPEGAQTAEPGSMYFRTNGTIYYKGSGSGNTGWTAISGGAMKVITNGYDVLPSLGQGAQMTSGGANAYGAWLELSAALPVAAHIVGFQLTAGTAATYMQLQLGTGAAAAEVAVLTAKVDGLTIDAPVILPFPVAVANGVRLAARFAESSGAKTARVSVLYIDQAKLTSI